MSSRNFVQISNKQTNKKFGGRTIFFQHFSQKENATQNPETMDGRLCWKNKAFNKSSSHALWDQLSEAPNLFQNSQLFQRLTLLIPEWDR